MSTLYLVVGRITIEQDNRRCRPLVRLNCGLRKHGVELTKTTR